MSDNIPFDIQREIIKRVSNVKSLIRFRSVSKPWKSVIDTSDFIKGYGARHTQLPSHILCLSLESEHKYICLVDDDDNFKVQEPAPFVVSSLLKQYISKVVGACHGLLCLYGFHQVYKEWMVIIWNPSIGKSFGIATPQLPQLQLFNPSHYGFGVCPVTKDPTVVKLKHRIGMPWNVEVFTLSSGVWNVIPSANLLHESVRINHLTQVTIGRFIYWGARDTTSAYAKNIVVSFDLITKEFKVVDLPDSLANMRYGPYGYVSVSKLRDSLVVYGGRFCVVWVMEHDSSFKKLFTIGSPVDKILGFKKNGEPIFESRTADIEFTTLHVYDPCSQQIKNLGISGDNGSFFMGSYKESLLLLDHSDLRIYSDDS